MLYLPKCVKIRGEQFVSGVMGGRSIIFLFSLQLGDV